MTGSAREIALAGLVRIRPSGAREPSSAGDSFESNCLSPALRGSLWTLLRAG